MLLIRETHRLSHIDGISFFAAAIFPVSAGVI